MTASAILANLKQGDVCVVRTSGWAGWWIRLGSALRGQPNLDNHVVVVDHRDAHGTVWGIEGRPGGVGWVDVAQYFTMPNAAYMTTNIRQPKTAEQRRGISTFMKSMLGTRYDWEAIEQDGFQDLHLPQLWGEKWNGVTPGHVVCSSVAVWAYKKNLLDYPKTTDLRHIEPSDWTVFCLDNSYD